MDTMYEYKTLGTDFDEFENRLMEMLRQGWEAVWHDGEFDILLRRPLENSVIEYTWTDPDCDIDVDESWVPLGTFDDGYLVVYCRPLSK